MSDFLPEGYEAPKSSANYMKFEKGDNKFRILSKPILGWLDWKDKKPLRFRMSEKPDAPIDATKPIKHFWAMVVYNYRAQKVQILELTQSSIQTMIQDYSKSEDWGNPLEYDLNIVKKGEEKNTEYSVIASPPKPITDAIKSTYQSFGIINMDALYEGGDPFAMSTNNG
jgi:hypothetical protein